MPLLVGAHGSAAQNQQQAPLRVAAAYAATTLPTDADMTLRDVRLEAGDYSLFVLDGRGRWQLIVSRRSGISGRDVRRIPLASRALGR